MVKYGFKGITTVPSSEDFVDIMLSKTNRQTPTVVHARWKISSIRQFYMRKVKFTQNNMLTRLNTILNEFPQLDRIHPFYSDLMNVLYDKDHYKIALSQLNICKQIITNIGKDYIKLLKYGDSLYRCKQLKRAALGRMVKIIRKQKASLAYLEQVRQHLSRLPTIDCNERTLILTGFPNTGKSSFMNKCTKADVEVKNYPFTTKSLYVGHCDYNYLRWQIIDSPGVLDRELKDRNTIEMQAITALAHLNATILYFIDLSPLTQYSIQQQCRLFNQLKPLFNNKPVLIICNKADLRKLNDLNKSELNEINKIAKFNKNTTIMEMSNINEFNVMNVRNKACDLLLDKRVDIKLNNNNTKNIDMLQNKLFIAYPQKRDNKIRGTNIPQTVIDSRKNGNNNNNNNNDKPRRDYVNTNYDPRSNWILDNPDWKYDPIPKFYNGKNISDFYSNDISQKLMDLEDEEEKIIINEINNPMAPELTLKPDEELLWEYIDRKQKIARMQHRHKKRLINNRPQIPRKDIAPKSLSTMREEFEDLGINTTKIVKEMKKRHNEREGILERRGRSRVRKWERYVNPNSVDPKNVKNANDIQQIARSNSRKRLVITKSDRSKSRARSRSMEPDKGISTINASEKARKLKLMAMKVLNKQGRIHESDRGIFDTKPKHLHIGKGRPWKADWR